MALFYDSPVTNTKAEYTYRELRDQVALFAGTLAGLGVQKGDRVVIYMPMVPRAVTAMLACARIGAIHSVVFGGFAARELAVRIDDAKPIRPARQNSRYPHVSGPTGISTPQRERTGPNKPAFLSFREFATSRLKE